MFPVSIILSHTFLSFCSTFFPCFSFFFFFSLFKLPSLTCLTAVSSLDLHLSSQPFLLFPFHTSPLFHFTPNFNLTPLPFALSKLGPISLVILILSWVIDVPTLRSRHYVSFPIFSLPQLSLALNHFLFRLFRSCRLFLHSFHPSNYHT